MTPVEIDRGIGIGGHELVPADVVRAVDREDVAAGVGLALGRERVHEVEGRALRVGDHRDAADAGLVLRPHMLLAALGEDRGDGGVDIGDMKIAEPGGPRAACLHLVGQGQHATRIPAVAALDHAIFEAGSDGVGVDAPPDDGVVETLRRRRFGGHQFVPDEGSRRLSHRLSPRS